MFDDLAFVSLFLLAPQPLYYIVGESIKLASDYSDFYYPNGWQFFGQMVFIFILYAPSFALVFFNRRMIRTCIRRKHPDYDFTENTLSMMTMIKHKQSPKANDTHITNSEENTTLLARASQNSNAVSAQKLDEEALGADGKKPAKKLI